MYGKNAKKPVEGGITQEDIMKIRKKTKYGDRIRCYTLKACSTDSAASSKTAVLRTGKVIGNFQNHVYLRFENGITESILWSDLIKKQSSRPKKDSQKKGE